MAVETFLISNALTNILKRSTVRFRPLTYNENLSVERTVGGSRYSFPSGHVSATASFSFYTAKVFSDLYPHSKWKNWVWPGAISLPAVTGYLRYEAGKHFPTDILAGYAVGATIGYLVPHFHKNKGKDSNLNLVPTSNGLGLELSIN